MSDPRALPSSVSRHFAGIQISGPLAISAVAVGLVVLVLVVGLLGLVASVMSGGLGDDEARTRLSNLVAKHDTAIDEYRTRFEKRYIFFKPPPPPPPPRVVRDEPPPPPPPAPVKSGPPSVYQGPSIAWVIGEDVFFNMIVPTQTEKYFKVRMGEERNGVKVLSTENLPRTVRVAHMGGEYDVNVFGDSMNATSLFPVAAATSSVRPSITVPGFVPVAESSSPPAGENMSPADGEDEDDAGEPDEDIDEESGVEDEVDDPLDEEEEEMDDEEGDEPSRPRPSSTPPQPESAPRPAEQNESAPRPGRRGPQRPDSSKQYSIAPAEAVGHTPHV